MEKFIERIFESSIRTYKAEKETYNKQRSHINLAIVSDTNSNITRQWCSYPPCTQLVFFFSQARKTAPHNVLI